MIEALLFAAYFAAGLAGLAPSATTGDAGEFAASAATLAVPHPPGYPLYCLAAKAWGTLAPFGNWGYRTNLFSLACGALAVVLLYKAARRLGTSALAALTAALVLALAPEALYDHRVTEVFALNTLWAVLGLLMLARFRGEMWGGRSMAAFGLWTGLGLGNHHTLLLVGPAFAWEAFRSRRPGAAELARAAAAFSGFCLLGLGLYLYLPLRSAHGPPLDVGHPSGWDGVVRSFLRRDYGSLALTVGGPAPRGAASLVLQLARFAAGAAGAASAPAAVLGLLGLAAQSSRRGPLGGLFPWILLVGSGPLLLWIGNPPFNAELEGALTRFYLLPAAGLALGAAFAVSWAESKVGRAAALLLAVPLASLAAGRPAWALRSDFLAYDYGRGLLRSLPPGASFVMDGGDDTFYSLAFLRGAQGLRPDLEIHDRGGVVFAGLYGGDFRRLDREAKERRRLDAESRLAAAGRLYYSTMRLDLLPGWRLLPVGTAVKAVPEPSPERLGPADELFPLLARRTSGALLAARYRDRALAAFPLFMRGLADGELSRWEELERDFRAAALTAPDALWLKDNLNVYLDRYAFRLAQARDWASAEGLYRLSLELYPARAEAWSNLGVSLEKQGRLEEAENAQTMALGVDPAYAPAAYNLGFVAWRRGDFRSAAERWTRAVELEARPDWIRWKDAARRRAEGLR